MERFRCNTTTRVAHIMSLVTFIMAIQWASFIPFTHALVAPATFYGRPSSKILQNSWNRLPCTAPCPSTVSNSEPFGGVGRRHFQFQRRLPSTMHSSTSLFLKFPLIAAADSWGNVAALTGTATLAQFLGTTTAVGRLLGPPVTAMALTFFMASAGILNPGGTVAAQTLQSLAVQLATPLVLLGADLRDCWNRCGPLLWSFGLASFATLLACLVGWKLASQKLISALGGEGLKIAAALLAKNIGGGINYLAVCRTLSASPQSVAAGLCVDNLFALLYFPATSAMAAGRPDVNDEIESADDASNPTTSSPITVPRVSAVFFLASALLWIGETLGKKLFVGALPMCTLCTVIFASLAPRRILQPVRPAADVLGTFCLYLFFATAGAPGIAVAESVRASMLPLTIFLTSLYGIHGLVLWLSYRCFFGRNGNKEKTANSVFLPQHLLVASSAAIGGPATAATLAQANGWKSLVVPSILVGNFGYAIATFLGLAFYSFFQ